MRCGYITMRRAVCRRPDLARDRHRARFPGRPAGPNLRRHRPRPQRLADGAAGATAIAMAVELTRSTATNHKHPKGGLIMGIRTAQRRLGPVLGLAAFLGLALTFASSPAAAQQWTPEQRAACGPDGVRGGNQD